VSEEEYRSAEVPKQRRPSSADEKCIAFFFFLELCSEAQLQYQHHLPLPRPNFSTNTSPLQTLFFCDGLPTVTPHLYFIAVFLCFFSAIFGFFERVRECVSVRAVQKAEREHSFTTALLLHYQFIEY
jgi:hypothetical protein